MKLKLNKKTKMNNDSTYDLNLQCGHTEEEFWDYLKEIYLTDADERAKSELLNYLKEDFRRFCYTFSMLPDIKKEHKCFEIGSNPYYLTALIKKYTNYQLETGNCFDDNNKELYQSKQSIINGEGEKIEIEYVNLNIEENFYNQSKYDIVICCEVIEHMIKSPLQAILNMKKMLKDGGTLIMSTPNVCRLENVARMISGSNIYDPFSGYGLYGRHNREYNRDELVKLLDLCGFEVNMIFTSNVHDDYAGNYYNVSKIMELMNTIPHRSLDLGQYIFLRAVNKRKVEKVKVPEWLYRSLNYEFISNI